MKKQFKSITTIVLVLVAFYIAAANFSTIYDTGKDFGETLYEVLSKSD